MTEHKISVKLRYRSAQPQDIEFLLNLRKLSMNAHLSKAGFETSDQYHLSRIHESFGDSLIIEVNGNAVGLLKLARFSDRLHIRQFQILPKFHNKGIGGKVLNSVKNKANSLKLPITLNVLFDNPARSLYLRHGFEVIGQTEFEFQMRYQNA